MREIIERMDPRDCGQLNGKASCEGCRIFETAKALIADDKSDSEQGNGEITIGRSLVLQLRSNCAPGAQMNLEALGITDEIPRQEYRERGPYFVRSGY